MTQVPPDVLFAQKASAVAKCSGIDPRDLDLEAFRSLAPVIFCRAYSTIYKESLPVDIDYDPEAGVQFVIQGLSEKTGVNALTLITGQDVVHGSHRAIGVLVGVLFAEGQRMWMEKQEVPHSSSKINDKNNDNTPITAAAGLKSGKSGKKKTSIKSQSHQENDDNFECVNDDSLVHIGVIDDNSLRVKTVKQKKKATNKRNTKSIKNISSKFMNSDGHRYDKENEEEIDDPIPGLGLESGLADDSGGLGAPGSPQHVKKLMDKIAKLEIALASTQSIKDKTKQRPQSGRHGVGRERKKNNLEDGNNTLIGNTSGVPSPTPGKGLGGLPRRIRPDRPTSAPSTHIKRKLNNKSPIGSPSRHLYDPKMGVGAGKESAVVCYQLHASDYEETSCDGIGSNDDSGHLENNCINPTKIKSPPRSPHRHGKNSRFTYDMRSGRRILMSVAEREAEAIKKEIWDTEISEGGVLSGQDVPRPPRATSGGMSVKSKDKELDEEFHEKGPTLPQWPGQSTERATENWVRKAREERDVSDLEAKRRAQAVAQYHLPRFFGAYSKLEPLDMVISIEHCFNCQCHNSHLRHNPADYIKNADSFLALIAKMAHASKLSVRLGVTRFNANITTKSKETDTNSRVGAFEIQIALRSPSGGMTMEVLHSKLSTRRWPSKAVLEKRFKSYCSKNMIPSYFVQEAEYDPGEETYNDTATVKDGLSGSYNYPMGRGSWAETSVGVLSDGAWSFIPNSATPLETSDIPPAPVTGRGNKQKRVTQEVESGDLTNASLSSVLWVYDSRSITSAHTALTSNQEEDDDNKVGNSVILRTDGALKSPVYSGPDTIHIPHTPPLTAGSGGASRPKLGVRPSSASNPVESQENNDDVAESDVKYEVNGAEDRNKDEDFDLSMGLAIIIGDDGMGEVKVSTLIPPITEDNIAKLNEQTQKEESSNRDKQNLINSHNKEATIVVSSIVPKSSDELVCNKEYTKEDAKEESIAHPASKNLHENDSSKVEIISKDDGKANPLSDEHLCNKPPFVANGDGDLFQTFKALYNDDDQALVSEIHHCLKRAHDFSEGDGTAFNTYMSDTCTTSSNPKTQTLRKLIVGGICKTSAVNNNGILSINKIELENRFQSFLIENDLPNEVVEYLIPVGMNSEHEDSDEWVVKKNSTTEVDSKDMGSAGKNNQHKRDGGRIVTHRSSTTPIENIVESVPPQERNSVLTEEGKFLFEQWEVDPLNLAGDAAHCLARTLSFGSGGGVEFNKYLADIVLSSTTRKVFIGVICKTSAVNDGGKLSFNKTGLESRFRKYLAEQGLDLECIDELVPPCPDTKSMALAVSDKCASPSANTLKSDIIDPALAEYLDELEDSDQEESSLISSPPKQFKNQTKDVEELEGYDEDFE